MRYVVVLLWIICGWLASPLAAQGHLFPADVELWIEMPKSNYAECEDMSVFLFVANDGRRPARIPRIDPFGYSGFVITLVDSSGQQMEYTGLIGELGPAARGLSTEIKPGDTLLFHIDLLGGFAIGGWRTRYPRHLPCGIYEVYGTLDGLLESNHLRFSVGRLDDVSDTLIAEYWALVMSPTDKASKIASMAKMVRRFPNSPVASRICRDLVGKAARDSTFSDISLEFRTFLVEHHPENGVFSGYVYVLLRDLDDADFLEVFSRDAAFKRGRISSFTFRQVLKEQGRSDLIQEVMGQ